VRMLRRAGQPAPAAMIGKHRRGSMPIRLNIDSVGA
jgi:hypothetical protein